MHEIYGWLIGIGIVLVAGITIGCLQVCMPPSAKNIAREEHSSCLDKAKLMEAQCRRGILKTTRKIKACHAIYEEDVAKCDTELEQALSAAEKDEKKSIKGLDG